MNTTTLAAWLLTYLIHSTVILGAALTVSRILGGRHLSVQEGVLRIALVGGIVTATLQAGLGIDPMSGVLSLESVSHPAGIANVSDLTTVQNEYPLAASAMAARPGRPIWAAPLVIFWVMFSMIALVSILRSILDLRRLLDTRCFQPAGRLVESLAVAMGLRRRVRISTSKAIAVPFATGIRRPEICCPERVNDLAVEHKRGLFAHELAHIARRDPVWQLLYRLGEAIFVLQPLNTIVRRRLEEIAEHLTDERAVAGTGDRLGLARCLVVVAHWGHSGSIGLPATTLAAGPRLDRRVRRLISGKTERQISSRWTAAAGIVLLVGAVSVLPAVGTSPAHAGSSPPPAHPSTVWSIAEGEADEGSKTVEARTWSTVDDRPGDASPAPESPPDEPSAETPPTPPSPATAPSATDDPSSTQSPMAQPAPESPPTAPAPVSPPTVSAPKAPTPSQIPPVPPVPPAPVVDPAPKSQAEPLAPSSRERSRESERQLDEARRRSSERSRAESLAREQRDASRIQAEKARETARESARQSRLSEAQRQEMKREARDLEVEAYRLAREEMRAERERSRIELAEARARARESMVDTAKLTAEQREAIEREATELRLLAEVECRESSEAAEARARELAAEARALAEWAEAERREKESGKK